MSESTYNTEELHALRNRIAEVIAQDSNFVNDFTGKEDSMGHLPDASALIFANQIMQLITSRDKAIREEAEEAARVKGIIEALEGVSQQHYGYKGELVIDTYLSIKDRLRPEGEDPAFSLPISEAIEFYKEKLAALHSTNTKPLEPKEDI